ncbi:hypothetical protein Tco_0897226 [Tanacetum coccineum]
MMQGGSINGEPKTKSKRRGDPMGTQRSKKFHLEGSWAMMRRHGTKEAFFSCVMPLRIDPKLISKVGLLVVGDRMGFKSFLYSQAEYLEGNSLSDCSLSDLKMLKSHRVHNRWEPEHPRDVDLESRNAEKIRNPISEVFEVFCIVESLPKEYSPYVFRFTKTCKEPTHIELYEVMCKVEDDLQIIAHDKTNERRAEDKENEDKFTGRNYGFFYKRVTKKRKALPKCYYC